MIKYIVVGAVVVASTLLGSHSAEVLFRGDASGKASGAQKKSELMKLDAVSVPVIRNRQLEGYVVIKVILEVDSDEFKKNRVALQAYGTEVTLLTVYEDQDTEFFASKPINFDAITSRIVKRGNSRLGRPVFSAAAVEGIQYIKEADLRCQRKT